MELKKKKNTDTFSKRLLGLISEPSFIKFVNILSEPTFFKIVGRTHYERWHACFWGWLLDANGSHLISNYVLIRFLFLLLDEKTLKAKDNSLNRLIGILPTADFYDIEVSPNEYTSSETSIKNVGRFDIFLSPNYRSKSGIQGRLNILFELKIDSKIDSAQSRKYADWLHKNHPHDINFAIYILPRLLSDSKATVGDERWYCIDYQLLNDKLLIPILDHPNLNEKVKPFIVQYIKNLKIRHKGAKMAITNEEKRLATELYQKYSDVFDSIYDALQESKEIDYSTSDLPTTGRQYGRIAVRIDGKVFEGDMLRSLFKKVLKYLVDNGYLERLPLPWGEGNTRYIVTNEERPIHPSGRDFFYPETYKGYTIETHYGRERGLSVLDSLCRKLEIEFESIEV